MPQVKAFKMGKNIELEQGLWDAFCRMPSEENAEALITHYTPLVSRVVRQMAVYTPQHMDIDDLMQHGLLGLLTAIGRYDPTAGIPFEAYALRRIRGSVRDALRAQDPLTRTDRACLKKIDEMVRRHVMEFGVGPDEEELAHETGMSLEKMQALLVRAQPWISLDAMVDPASGESRTGVDHLADNGSPNPRKETILHEQIARFRSAFRKLKPRQQKILYLYYFEDLTLREISAIFELSEARICQLHSSILIVLKALLTNAVEEG
jgi:RNA polymerase sigma factor for flagellar operon FliA